MSEGLATLLVAVAGLYFGLGLLFAIAFVLRGVGVIDPQARDGSWGFRVLVVPGSAALWPLLLRRWWRREPPPVERNCHRERVTVGGRDRNARAGGSTTGAPG